MNIVLINNHKNQNEVILFKNWKANDRIVVY